MKKQQIKEHIQDRKTDTENNENKTAEDDSIIFDLPEVKDIPGQENIKPPRFREMMDTTISSADEEGEGILDDVNEDDDDDEIVSDNGDVSAIERDLSKKTDRPINEEAKDRIKLSLDKTDGDEELNEKANPEDLGKDLDIPEADEDNNEPGEEDEENNVYSLPD